MFMAKNLKREYPMGYLTLFLWVKLDPLLGPLKLNMDITNTAAPFMNDMPPSNFLIKFLREIWKDQLSKYYMLAYTAVYQCNLNQCLILDKHEHWIHKIHL